MSNDLTDIVDKNNLPTDEQKLKSEIYKSGEWHRSIHVWIYNSKGEILLQLRGKDKKLYPNVWDVSAAGSVDTGEEPITAALRETEEEIGLKIKPDNLEFIKIKKSHMVYKEIINNEFIYLYFYKFDGNLDDLKIQAEELDDIKFFSINEMKQGLKNDRKKYLNHDNYWEEIFEEVEKRI